MKKKFILMPIIGTFLFAILSGNSGGPGASSLGDRTGISSTTITGCGGGCHGTSSSPSTTVLVQLYDATSALATSYTPGLPYTIRLTATYGTSSATTLLTRYGFQVGVVKSATTTNAGTMVAPAATHLGIYSGINIVEHGTALPVTAGSGLPGSTYVMNIAWTAPAAGTGSVDIKAVMNLVDADGFSNAADKWNFGSAIIAEATTTTLGPITGSLSICAGATGTLSNATPGGGWLSGNTAVATIGTSSGIVTGVSAGSSIITYGTSITSFVTATLTVLAAPGPITGVSSPCVGASISLSNATAGGTWSSTNTAVGSISSSGVVTGITAGATVISYTNSAGCAATATVNINSGTPTAIAGPASVCVGTTITLSNGVLGGTWTSTTPAKATVGSSSGVVTGVAIGSTTISYSVTNVCGTGSVSRTVAVLAAGLCSSGAAYIPVTEPELKVYPNPNTGSFTFNMLSDNAELVHVTIINMVGTKVKEFIANSNHETEISINQPAGIYILTATTERGNYTAKIMVR